MIAFNEPMFWGLTPSMPLRFARNEQGREFKQRLIDRLGGDCNRCHYKTDTLAVYEFHHRNPKLKKFHLSQEIMQYKTWEQVKVEAAKCSVLCANCHREVHHKNDKRFFDVMA